MPSQHKFAHWRYNTGKTKNPTSSSNQNSRAVITVEKAEFVGRNFSLTRKPNRPNPLKVTWGYNRPVTPSEPKEIFQTPT